MGSPTIGGHTNPASHGTGADAFQWQNEPCGHGMGSLDPSGQNPPSPHGFGIVVQFVEHVYPAGHMRNVSLLSHVPAMGYLSVVVHRYPRGHAKGDDASPQGQYSPCSHATHNDAFHLKPEKQKHSPMEAAPADSVHEFTGHDLANVAFMTHVPLHASQNGQVSKKSPVSSTSPTTSAYDTSIARAAFISRQETLFNTTRRTRMFQTQLRSTTRQIIHAMENISVDVSICIKKPDTTALTMYTQSVEREEDFFFQCDMEENDRAVALIQNPIPIVALQRYNICATRNTPITSTIYSRRAIKATELEPGVFYISLK